GLWRAGGPATSPIGPAARSHSPPSSVQFGSMSAYVISSLYKFVELSDPEALRVPLLERCKQNSVQGTLILAGEGINGTICGKRDAIDQVLAWLRQQPGLEDLDPKESLADEPAFHRLKVRVKNEILTLRDDEISPRTRVGTYVEPEDWNELIADPDVIVIDTRNEYEVRVGTFEGAIDPDIRNFSEFPAWAEANLDSERPPKIAMFCTGGIRCEKASSLLLREGFPEVYHLHGGILRYLERVEENDSKWTGECFVFDQRVALNHSLQPGQFSLCYGCQEPIGPEERDHPDFELGVTCPRCAATTSEATRERKRERVRQVELAHSRGERHIGS
ncbi:MAG: UPF0176 protein, partial [Hyphomicrobiaceae bacterium]